MITFAFSFRIKQLRKFTVRVTYFRTGRKFRQQNFLVWVLCFRLPQPALAAYLYLHRWVLTPKGDTNLFFAGLRFFLWILVREEPVLAFCL